MEIPAASVGAQKQGGQGEMKMFSAQQPAALRFQLIRNYVILIDLIPFKLIPALSSSADRIIFQ